MSLPLQRKSPCNKDPFVSCEPWLFRMCQLSDWSHHGDSKVPLASWCYSSSTHSSKPKTLGVKIWLGFSAIEKIVWSTNLVHGNQGMVSALRAWSYKRL